MTFLPEEAVNDPKALHNVFVEMREAYAKEKVPMSKDQSGMFICILLSTPEQADGLFKDLSGTFPIGAFFKRMEIFPVKFEKKCLLLLGLVYMEYGVGGLILIGYYLQWLASITGATSLTADWIGETVWPWGIFSKETVHTFWDKQKVKTRPDNLVDHATAAASFLNSELIAQP
jgi:hypothetical protein